MENNNVKLSARVTISLLMVVSIITSCLVYFLGEKSFLVETEIILAIISFVLFAFLVFGLYLGAKLEDDTPSYDASETFKKSDIAENMNMDVGDVGGDDFFGVIFAVLLWIFFSGLILIIAWVLINIVASFVALLFVLIYWIAYQALKLVFANIDMCKGDILKSILTSLVYTILYVGWMMIMIEIIKYNQLSF